MKLIETHINGALGHTFAGATPEQIVQIRRHLEKKHHIGAFLASMVSLPHDAILKGIRAVREAMRAKEGADIVGIHLEGPYLNPDKRGAHRLEHLRKPSVREFAECVKAADGTLKMITIAPELPRALDVIREAKRAGVIVSLGHSNAAYEEAVKAIKAGAAHVTHIFNAMRPFHHREPGLVEAGLFEPVYVEVIYDRVHVSKYAMELVLRCKDRSRIVLASDASGALDAPDGEYTLDGIHAVVRGGKIVSKDRGRLAGSAVGLWQCYRNFREDFGGGAEFVTRNPARLLGIPWK